MRYLYIVLFYLALPFIFLRLLWRSRHNPAYRQGWAQRLGFCPFRTEKCIWIHAVSMGETMAAIPLIKALKKTYPNLPIVVTTTTVTGAAAVKSRLGDMVLHTFIPYDLPDAMGRFLDRTNPCVAAILETELWPNLFAACQARHIPIVVINACLSEKSMNGYKKIPSLTKNMLSAIHGIAAQGNIDAERFIALGLSPEKVTVAGNIKFALEIPSHLAEQSAVFRPELGNQRLIWVAASTHPTEENIILAAHRLIKKTYPHALLILVPRHPERFDNVATMCKEDQWHLARRSNKEICTPETDVYLGDTMGELLLMYSVSDVAFVGGSFAAIGGHNVLEAAALHKPIITGPSLFNVTEVRDMLLTAQGLFIAENAEQLAECVKRLFADADLRQRTGDNAYAVVEANQGNLIKQMQLITNFC